MDIETLLSSDFAIGATAVFFMLVDAEMDKSSLLAVLAEKTGDRRMVDAVDAYVELKTMMRNMEVQNG